MRERCVAGFDGGLCADVACLERAHRVLNGDGRLSDVALAGSGTGISSAVKSPFGLSLQVVDVELEVLCQLVARDRGGRRPVAPVVPDHDDPAQGERDGEGEDDEDGLGHGGSFEK